MDEVESIFIPSYFKFLPCEAGCCPCASLPPEVAAQSETTTSRNH